MRGNLEAVKVQIRALGDQVIGEVDADHVPRLHAEQRPGKAGDLVGGILAVERQARVSDLPEPPPSSSGVVKSSGLRGMVPPFTSSGSSTASICDIEQAIGTAELGEALLSLGVLNDERLEAIGGEKGACREEEGATEEKAEGRRGEGTPPASKSKPMRERGYHISGSPIPITQREASQGFFGFFGFFGFDVCPGKNPGSPFPNGIRIIPPPAPN